MYTAFGAGIGVTLVNLAGYSLLRPALTRLGEVSLVDGNILHRLGSFRTVLNILRVHPWLGLGLSAGGASTTTSYLDYRAFGTELLSTPDNAFLRVAADSGLLGLSAIAALMGSVLLSLFLAYQRTKNPTARGFLWATLLGVVAFVGQGFVFDALSWRNVVLVFWVIVGLGMRVAVGSCTRGWSGGQDETLECA